MLVTLPLWFVPLRTIWHAKRVDRLLTFGARSERLSQRYPWRGVRDKDSADPGWLLLTHHQTEAAAVT